MTLYKPNFASEKLLAGPPYTGCRISSDWNATDLATLGESSLRPDGEVKGNPMRRDDLQRGLQGTGEPNRSSFNQSHVRGMHAAMFPGLPQPELVLTRDFGDLFEQIPFEGKPGGEAVSLAVRLSVLPASSPLREHTAADHQIVLYRKRVRNGVQEALVLDPMANPSLRYRGVWAPRQDIAAAARAIENGTFVAELYPIGGWVTDVPAPPVEGDPILVIDVSHHNGQDYDKPDGMPLSHFRTLKRNGVEGVYIKVTEGVAHIDEDAAKHVAKAREVGMAVGLYHFAHDGDVVQQVEHFLTQARKANGGTLDDLLLVVDAEWASWADAAKGPTIRKLGELLQTKAPRNTIALYTAGGYIKSIGNPQLADTYDLVINAAWDGVKHRMVDIKAPALPPRAGYGGWSGRPKFCQIGPLHYGVAGKQHAVDLDLFYGSREKFDALWDTTVAKPPPDPDETPGDAERYLAEYNGRIAVIEQAVRGLPQSPSEGGKEATEDVLELLQTLHIGKVEA